MSSVSTIPAAPQRMPALVLVVAARAALWIAWLLGLLIWAPRVENVFQRFGLRIPSSASPVVALTHGLIPFGVLLVLVLITLDGTVSYGLRQSGNRALWSRLMTVVLLATISLTAVDLSRAMLLLLEALDKVLHG
jgi:type II secretory pathway component PulF